MMSKNYINYNLITYCGGFAGALPDLVEAFYPLGLHGSWSHTIITSITLSLIYSIIHLIIIRKFNIDLTLNRK